MFHLGRGIGSPSVLVTSNLQINLLIELIQMEYIFLHRSFWVFSIKINRSLWISWLSKKHSDGSFHVLLNRFLVKDV